MVVASDVWTWTYNLGCCSTPYRYSCEEGDARAPAVKGCWDDDFYFVVHTDRQKVSTISLDIQMCMVFKVTALMQHLGLHRRLNVTYLEGRVLSFDKEQLSWSTFLRLRHNHCIHRHRWSWVTETRVIETGDRVVFVTEKE